MFECNNIVYFDCVLYFCISFTHVSQLIFQQGFVTTFKPEDIPTLKMLLSQKPESITQAGLHPTAEQIELYAYHLPNSSLSNLMVCYVTVIFSVIPFLYYSFFI